MNKNEDIYAPETINEEALMLMGRVNAFAAYVKSKRYSIDREVCAAMLGFELEDEECSTSE